MVSYISHIAATLVFGETMIIRFVNWMKTKGSCPDFILEALEVCICQAFGSESMQGDNYDTIVHARDMHIRIDDLSSEFH